MLRKICIHVMIQEIITFSIRPPQALLHDDSHGLKHIFCDRCSVFVGAIHFLAVDSISNQSSQVGSSNGPLLFAVRF